MRDIRLQVSVTRDDLDKLDYLADVNGKRLARYVHDLLRGCITDALPVGSDAAYYYDLARRLKRAGQGYRELERGELDQRVSEAIEHGAEGKLSGSGDGATADQGALPSMPVASTDKKPRSGRRNRSRKHGDRGESDGGTH